MKYYIGIDLGGTNIKAGLVDEAYKINKVITRPTIGIGDARTIAGEIASIAKNLMQECNVELDQIISMGIGVPGTVDKKRGRIQYANNLELVDAELISVIQGEFQFSIYLENDANTVAWAEYVAGCAEDAKSLIAITLGTGVGAGIVIDGHVFTGCNGGAGEIGHMTIKWDGPECNCGRRGCFENYASANALLEQARESMKDHRDSLLWGACNQNPESLNGEQFFEILYQEDEAAVEVFGQYLRYLAAGIVNIINIFQPEVICIGGGISKAGDYLLKPLCNIVNQEVYTRGDSKQTRICIAKMNNDAGILGAALLRE